MQHHTQPSAESSLESDAEPQEEYIEECGIRVYTVEEFRPPTSARHEYDEEEEEHAIEANRKRVSVMLQKELHLQYVFCRFSSHAQSLPPELALSLAQCRDYSEHAVTLLQAMWRQHQVKKQFIKMKKRLWHRDKCVKELWETEKTYVDGLNVLVHVSTPVCFLSGRGGALPGP